MRIVEQAILATDLALYFRRKDQFLETANKGEIDWQDQDKKDCKLFDFLLLWPSSCLFFLEFASHDLKCMGKCFGSKVRIKNYWTAAIKISLKVMHKLHSRVWKTFDNGKVASEEAFTETNNIFGKISEFFPRKIVNFDNFLMQKVSSLILEVFVKKIDWRLQVRNNLVQNIFFAAVKCKKYLSFNFNILDSFSFLDWKGIFDSLSLPKINLESPQSVWTL